MKSSTHTGNKWIWVCVLIIAGLVYELHHQIKLRQSQDKVINELVIAHDSEMADMVDFTTSMTQRQIVIENELYQNTIIRLNMQRTIYEMYNELRKYDKTLPPWGGAKPLNPDDDFTKQ